MGKYKLLKTIGKGNFAKVKLARHMPTGQDVRVLCVCVLCVCVLCVCVYVVCVCCVCVCVRMLCVCAYVVCVCMLCGVHVYVYMVLLRSDHDCSS